MRTKIQDLADGKMEYEKPIPEFSSERLELGIVQGENYKGSFSVSSTNEMPLSGIIYSSNPRMECLTPQFEGDNITIQFEFHSKGLTEGDIQKGDFYLVLNGGEYNLSFVATVAPYYPNSSIGKIKNLFDFTNLAQVSFPEAFGLFKAPCFLNILRDSQTRERMLYAALGKNRVYPQAMEEFLIGIRKKNRVLFHLEETEIKLAQLTEPVKEHIHIQKEHWGYVEISVSADAAFLLPVKQTITAENFVGNAALAEVVIEPKLLHKGKNYGRIIFKTPHQREVCVVCVHQGADGEAVDRGRKRRLWSELTKLYLEFRMQQIITGEWSKKTCIRLDQLLEQEPQNKWYWLFKAQALLINNQRQEAEWILDSFKKENKEKDTPVWAFYLYLCTLWEQEPGYVAKLIKQIKDIYHKNQDNPILFFIMLFCDEEMENSKSRKLKAIEQRVCGGLSSPVFYMEALLLLKSDIYLLKKAESFEMQVLHWAMRNKALTTELAIQTVNLVAQIHGFHPVWYRILKSSYELTQDKDMLRSICGYCIKWNCYGSEFFYWYDQGIKAELRLAGLYEAWMLSVDGKRTEPFPRQITMYFQYQSSLDYRRQALLYATIIEGKAKQSSLYASYQKNMEDFGIKQLLAGKIDENLAVIYEDLLAQGGINQDVANSLSHILYTNKLTCQDENAVWVVVTHPQLKDEQLVPIVNHQADIELYTSSYCILLEDARGQRYAEDNSWQLEKLMKTGHYMKECIKYAKNDISFLLHYFDGRKTWQTFQKEDISRLLFLLESEAVCDSYKEELKLQIIEYCYNSYSGEELDHYLQQVEYQGLPRNARNQLMELMIARGIYDRAYEMLLGYGDEQAAVGKLLAIASQQIIKREYEPDKFLLGLCHTVFHRGKYNEIILKYLSMYFNGNVREMERVYQAANEFGLETYGLAERFLIQLLYTEEHTKSMEDIFQSYYQAGGKEEVVQAYLSYFSYLYFVKNTLVAESLFVILERQLDQGQTLNDCCRLAYLEWLIQHKNPSARQLELREELVKEYIIRGMHFASFWQLPQELLRKYHIYDKTFLEYRTNPAHRVTLCYSYGLGAYVEEELLPVFEGIFVKEFVVFYGEEITYYIKEETQKGEIITESGQIDNYDMHGQGDETRYDFINGMMVSYHHQDEKTLQKLIVQYQTLDYMVEQIFQLL